MNKTTKIVVGIAAIVILVVIGSRYVGKQQSSDNQKQSIKNELTKVKIGFVAPMSGEAAPYGEFVVKAFKMAIEDYNNTHKDLNIEVVYEDGKCDGKEAVSALNKLINIDKIKYVVGGLCSGETLAMAPIAEANQIILFSPGSGSPDITNAGYFIFRNFPSDDYTAKEVAKVSLKNGDNKIAIISENIDYPQALKKAFKNYYIAKGGEISLDEAFNTGTTDFRTILTKAKAQNVTSIYLLPQTYKTASLLLRQMKEQGFSPKIYASESTISQESLAYYDTSYKNLLEGAIFTQPKFDENNPKSADLLNKIKEKYGTTDGPFPPIYLATYYDSVYLLGEAIQNAGNNTEKVKDYLYGIKNWQGTIGDFSFDKNGDAVMGVEAKTVKNGMIISL